MWKVIETRCREWRDFLDADSLSQAKEESRKPGFSTNYADEMSHLRMI